MSVNFGAVKDFKHNFTIKNQILNFIKKKSSFVITYNNKPN